MAENRTYLVLPAHLIHEHAMAVEAKDRWKAWRAARDADPELDQERVAIVRDSKVEDHGDLVTITAGQVLEVGGERWEK